MCTVTVVPVKDGYRLWCNRDERLDRPATCPPTVRALEHRIALFPIDPIGPGTWVGVNDVGLAAALLNRSGSRPVPSHCQFPRSRGVIVPAVLDSSSLFEALELCAGLDLRAFARFRLVIVHGGLVGIAESDGHVLSVKLAAFPTPVMHTSSSLGDGLVEPPRNQLFERLFAKERSWLRAQRRFHNHRRKSRREISVLMERADARTVSQTVVRVGARHVELRYREVGSRQLQRVKAA